MSRPVRWLLVALFAAAIFAASRVQPPATSLGRLPGIDKVAHFIIYFFFAAAVYRALIGEGLLQMRAAAAAAVVAAIYGATDEIHQSFVPGRHASWGDWAADAFGGIALLGVVWLRTRLQARR